MCDGRPRARSDREALQKYKHRSDPLTPSAHLGAELWLLLRQLERMYKVYHTVCLGRQLFE